MNIFTIGRWIVSCDPKITMEKYVNIKNGAAEICDCDDCKNYLIVREKSVPKEFYVLLDQLGIDAKKEAEVYRTHRISPRIQSYGGWYHFVGKLDREEKFTPEIGAQIVPEPFVDGCEVRVASPCGMVSEAFDGLQILELQFLLELPWSLNSDDPE